MASLYTSELTAEDLFDILSNQRRRYTIHYLCQQGENVTVDVSSLARHVAAWERGVSPESVSGDNRRSVYNTLNQTHLPLLAEAGVVDYDERSKQVELLVSTDAFRSYTYAKLDYFPSVGALMTVAAANLAISLLALLNLGWTSWLVPLSATTLLLVGVVHFVQVRQARFGTSGPPPELRRG